MIYFTSDLHLGHSNILSLCKRPFADVEEMNEVLIENYNKTVKSSDTVYIIGDICYRLELQRCNNLIKRLHGHKILIKGNHDLSYKTSLFDEILDFKYLKLDDGVRFALMHYPLLEWPSFYHGSYHVHGHLHESMEYNLRNKEKGIRRYDIGVDANNYTPVSIDYIIDFFKD